MLKRYSVDKIRNVGLFSHGGSGKTSLAEALLFTAGVIDRLGKATEGTTAMDYDPEEVKRKITINTALAPIEWKDHKINLVDTPGYLDFVGDVVAAMRVVDGALILVDAVSGAEVGTEKVWDFATERQLPRVIVINKMDRENANFANALDNLTEKFGNRLAPIMLPIGQESNFQGVVDLVKKKAYYYKDASGKKIEEKEIPANLADEVEQYRARLMEAVAEADDDLMMKFLDGETLTDEEIQMAVRVGTRTGKFVPVACGAGVKNIGSAQLLDILVDCFPSPADMPVEKATHPDTLQPVEIRVDPNGPMAALVFKTMADPYVGKLTLFKVMSGTFKSDGTVFNASKGRPERIGQLFVMKGKNQEPVEALVAGDLGAVAKLQDTTTSDTLCEKEHACVFERISFPLPVLSAAVEPKSKGDEDKIGTGFARLAEEDPTFNVHKDPETKQTVITGMGDLHLEVIVSRLAKKFGTEVNLVDIKIPYRETIRGSIKVEGKHKKQSGGKGQFGHVWIEMEPSSTGFEFVDKVFGGSVPRQYIPAVEKGLRETMEKGVLAGYPVVDIRCSLYDGSYHNVDSSEMAFKIAASLAFKKGFQQAKPALLEPIMNVEVTVPDEYMGDIIGDLNKKRGRILGMEPVNGRQVVRAMAPMAELFKYATDLRSITQGRGSFVMKFDHYEDAPASVAEVVIAAHKKDADDEE